LNLLEVLLRFTPLALGAIAPAWISLVILLLTMDDGFRKALALVLGRVMGTVVLAFLFLKYGTLLLWDESPGVSSPKTALVKMVIGSLLVIAAIANLVPRDSPRRSSPKWMTVFNRLNVGVGLVFGFALAFVTPRIVPLVFIGSAEISAARLSETQALGAVLLLSLVVTWPLLFPLLIYIAGRRQADRVLATIHDALARHPQWVNGGVLGLVGVQLLWSGIAAYLAG